MTKKARQRLQGLLAPKRPERELAITSDYGRHVLDMGLREVMPGGAGQWSDHIRRDVAARSRSGKIGIRPGVPSDDEFHVRKKRVISRSDLLSGLEALIDGALARAGAMNSDEDEPGLVALSESAGLTQWEYEAVMMRSNGLTWKEIAMPQGVTPSAAYRAGTRGFQKLREFILNC